MKLPRTGIVDCVAVPVSANQDSRGCLFELYRQSWPNVFPAKQWNACASSAGVVRGVHVHVDYHEFYTLPRGRVIIGLADIRRSSPSFGKSAQFEWTARESFAVIVPSGVAHVVLFEAESVLVFGLSDYWDAQYDVVGCQWDDPNLGFKWPARTLIRSDRDTKALSYFGMLQHYEERSNAWRSATGRNAPAHMEGANSTGLENDGKSV